MEYLAILSIVAVPRSGVQWRKNSGGLNRMKITTFNPMILSPHADDLISLFEELGFEKLHAPTVHTGTSEVTSTRMRDANGNHIDIAGVQSMPQDMTIIRMNVDNFDEAFKFLTEKGFKNTRRGQMVETAANKSALMISPSGFAFDLCQHLKDED